MPVTRTRRSPSRPATAPSSTWSATMPTGSPRWASPSCARSPASTTCWPTTCSSRAAASMPRSTSTASPPASTPSSRARPRCSARCARRSRWHATSTPPARCCPGCSRPPSRRRGGCGTRPRSASNAASVGSVTAGLAEQTLGTLDGATVLVIGAGKTAELVVTSLVARGRPHRPGRQPHRQPRSGARRRGSAARSARWTGCGDELAAADVVVSRHARAAPPGDARAWSATAARPTAPCHRPGRAARHRPGRRPRCRASRSTTSTCWRRSCAQPVGARGRGRGGREDRRRRAPQSFSAG